MLSESAKKLGERDRILPLQRGVRNAVLLFAAWWMASFAAFAEGMKDYAAVDAIFTEHCLDCHAGKDAEGQLVLESFDALMKGGEIGAAVVPGKSAESLLVQMIEGRFEK